MYHRVVQHLQVALWHPHILKVYSCFIQDSLKQGKYIALELFVCQYKMWLSLL